MYFTCLKQNSYKILNRCAASFKIQKVYVLANKTAVSDFARTIIIINNEQILF